MELQAADSLEGSEQLQYSDHSRKQGGGIWDSTLVRKFLRRPNIFVLTEPYHSWIEQRGGLTAVHTYLHELILSKDERNVLNHLLNDPEKSPAITAEEIGVGRTRYFEVLKSLTSVLAYHLNEWRVEEPHRLQDLPAARCRMLWGHKELIAKVMGNLRDPSAPHIVLLTAFGGYGKTELARSIAEKLVKAEVFIGVVWVSLKREEFQFTLGKASRVPLSFAPSRSTIVRRLMHHLACQSEDELNNRLRNEALLLVVDNLETLPLEEREAIVSDVHQLLGSGRSRALFTSRFDIVAPYVYKPHIEGLSFTESAALLLDEAHHFSGAMELRTASDDVIKKIWELTKGAPLALHLVVGQSQRYELRRVIANLEEARTHGVDKDFYRFLHYQAWQESNTYARALLVFMGAATRAPQTSLQLLGISVSADITFDEQTLYEALGELSQWFLIERAVPGEGSRAITYSLHSLTRAFVLSQEMREQWTEELDLNEASLREAATRKHQEILEREDQHVEAQQYAEIVARAIPDFLHSMHYYLGQKKPQQVLWYWQEISDYLWRHGYYPEYVECDQYALAAAGQLALIDPAEGQRKMAIISAELAFAHMVLGELDPAEQHIQAAEHLSRKFGDWVEMARVLRYRAAIQSRSGNWDAAEKLCQQAFRIIDEDEAARRNQNNHSVLQQQMDMSAGAAAVHQLVRGPIHSLLGRIYLEQGKYDAARKELLTALQIAHKRDEAKFYWSLGPMLNLGHLYERCSRVDKAMRYYQQCIALTEDGTSPNIRAAALLRMAMLVARGEQIESARHLAQEAVNLYEAMGTYSDKMEAVRFLETLSRKS